MRPSVVFGIAGLSSVGDGRSTLGLISMVHFPRSACGALLVENGNAAEGPRMPRVYQMNARRNAKTALRYARGKERLRVQPASFLAVTQK
jgi:hypothetical protein